MGAFSHSHLKTSWTVAGAFVGAALGATPAVADSWSYPVLQQEPPGFADPDPKHVPVTYEPLEAASEPWHICVSHPHMADPYHLAYNYGYVQEAKRLGVQVSVVEAGGYDKLPRQLSQIENCVALGADAVIISAISFTGLDGLVEQIDSAGVAVLDLGNGINSPLVKAHSLGSYVAIGRAVGHYLAEQHPEGSEKATVLWLPGPPGAGWSESGDKGFKEGIVGSALEILDTMYGNTNKPEQLKLIEDGLQTFPNIDYIVGVAPAAEAAVGAIREAGRDDIKIVAYYQTPEVAPIVEQGLVYAMASDSAVMQARIALDQAVRVLENVDYIEHVSPEILIVDESNSDTWDKQSALAPDGWAAEFNVEAPQ